MVKFNWASLDRTMIIDHMMRIESKLTNSNIPIEKFHKTLGNHIKKLAPVKIRKNRKCHEYINRVFVGGVYYSDLDQDKERCIEILFEYSFFDDEIHISNKKFARISQLVADTMLHEIIHMHQHRSRKFKILPDYNSKAKEEYIQIEQRYLGCPDEMDAYSFNIACELFEYFNDDVNQITKFLNSKVLPRKRIAPSWNKYYRTFEKNHDHPVLKRMKRQILKYLPMATLGKPYRTPEWINR